MREIYFENINGIGKLYLEHIFYEFESEPILFVCSDDNDNIYLCLCSEIRYIQKWIVSKCSISLLKKLIDEKLDVASSFLENSEVTVVEADLDGNEKNYCIDTEKIDPLDLPEEGTYIKCDKEKARDYLWKKELDKNMKKAKDCVQYMIDEKTLAHDSYIFGKYEEGQRINIKYKEVNSKIIFKNALEFNEILKRYKSDIKNISDVNEIRDMDSYIQAA